MADRLPVLPLRDTIVFPHVSTPVLVGRAVSMAAIEAAAAGDRRVLLVTQRRAAVDEPTSHDLHRVGVVARMEHLARLPNGTVKVVLDSDARVRVTRYLPPPAGGEPAALRALVAPFPLATADADAPDDPRALDARARRLVARFEEYATLQRRVPSEVAALLLDLPDPARVAWGVAAHLLVPMDARQQLLELRTLPALLGRLEELIAGECEVLGLERTLDERVRGTIARNQREFWLSEQLKAIHQELGHDEGDDLAELEAQLRARQLPAAVEARALREVRRLRRMAAVSPEATVARTYLDWILAPPTGGCPTWPRRAPHSTPTTTGSTRSRSASSTSWR